MNSLIPEDSNAVKVSLESKSTALTFVKSSAIRVCSVSVLATFPILFGALFPDSMRNIGIGSYLFLSNVKGIIFFCAGLSLVKFVFHFFENFLERADPSGLDVSRRLRTPVTFLGCAIGAVMMIKYLSLIHI